MTARRRTVAREPAPERPEEAASAEWTLIDGQLEATGDLRERVKVLESESKHYATKADLANAKADLANAKVLDDDRRRQDARWVIGALLSVIGVLVSALVALGIAFVRSSSGN